MSRQESRRRDLGKSLAQPENSVSFFVNRRVSQASKATHFLLPCIHIHDVLVARDTLIWWMSFPPVPHNVLIVVYCGDPDVGYGSCLERERDGGDPPKTRFLRPVDAIIPGKQNSVHLYSHFNRKRDLTTSSTRAGLPYWLGA